MRLTHVVSLMGVVCLGFGLGLRAEQSGRQAPPAFRGGTELIPVDVSVLDRDRKPVRDLTAADFQIFEDGQPRPVTAFVEVEVPTVAPTAAVASPVASWVRDAPREVVSNDMPPEGRLMAILLDRSIPAGAPVATAQAVANAAIDALGPGDLAAVVRSSGFSSEGRFQGFTADRDLLRRAAGTPFTGLTVMPEMSGAGLTSPSPVPSTGTEPLADVGDCYCGLCEFEAVENIARAMRDAPRRRKLLVIVGSAIALQEPMPGSQCFGIVKQPRDVMMRELEMSNITVHVVDPVGLITAQATAGYITHAGPQALSRTFAGFRREEQQRIDNLKILPDATGGRAVVSTNAPEEAMPDILAESQSYYLLGFEPRTAPAPDGTFHRIEVKVNRRGVTVHTRSGYAVYPDDDRDIPEDLADMADLVRTLDQPLPVADLPLTMSVAPLIVDDSDVPAVAVSLGTHLPMTPGASGRAREVALVVGAFDRRGQAVATHRQTVELPATADGVVDQGLVSRLNLEPGQYEIRAAVRDQATGTTGSAFGFVDVPAFGSAGLSLSGLIVRGSQALPMPDGLFGDLVGFAPTVARTFATGAPATVFAQVSSGTSPTPVSVVARVLDRQDAVVFEDTREVRVADAAVGPAVYDVTLPPAGLQAGDYLLTITATAGEATARREMRFAVR